MATIEPRRETVVKETFVITIDRDELKALIADPTPWLRDLKGALKFAKKK